MPQDQAIAAPEGADTGALNPLKPESRPFEIQSAYSPAGDQPQAITEIASGLAQGERDQVLLGVTGSGKTFTMAQVIHKEQRPTLLLAPNKTLAAQLYGEMTEFFPNNAVEYFVSYYDYYQPEAYVPRTDTYVEKESSINEQIDRMRHAATRALFEREDVIIVASVSCIYGMGAPETYASMTLTLNEGDAIDRAEFLRQLTQLQYKRNDINFVRGTFRAKGDVIEIFPAHYEDTAWRVSLFGDEIESIAEFDPLTGSKTRALQRAKLYPNSHYVTPRPTLEKAMKHIKEELKDRVEYFKQHNMPLEAERIEQRTTFDLEMMEATGSCQGIENYSRYLTGRNPGEPPPTLFEYLPENALLIVDESHVTVPQLSGMYRGDYARKSTLAEYGFRLPSCIDNRPLKFQEWEKMRPQTTYISATPGKWELEQTGGTFAEQIIRPTGLIDPVCDVRPTTDQVDDLIHEVKTVAENGQRALVTTLTKRMAEDLTEYLHEAGLKVRYIHSDVDTLERIEIIRDLRLGVFDVLVGINLLREGLDIPECALVAILDADKEGYLRSATALIQTIGRAARNVDGRVLLYADKRTKALDAAISETERRREKQQAYNAEHGITPETIRKQISDVMQSVYEKADHPDVPADEHAGEGMGHNLEATIEDLRGRMKEAAANLEFEEAARLRDEVKRLEQADLGVGEDGAAPGGGGFAGKVARAEAESKSRKRKGDDETKRGSGGKGKGKSKSGRPGERRR